MYVEYQVTLARTRELLQPDKSFDLEERRLVIGGREATAWFVDAMPKDEVVERLFSHFLSLTPQELHGLTAADFAVRHIPYTAAVPQSDPVLAVEQVLAGQTALLIDGLEAFLIIDLRLYPTRTLKEPEEDRVLLGAHDGFGEAIKTNLALVRRRLRSNKLRVHHQVIGDNSQTDVAVCWLEGTAKQRDIDAVLQRLDGIRLKTLTLGHESLSEALVRPRWWNPFPLFRYTERPDRAAAAVAEGKILVSVDNSPIVSMLPTALPDFSQDTNEYYFSPTVGTFLRWIRTAVLLLSLLLIPIWYTAEIHPSPDRWKIFWELMIAELVLDAVKLATLHTPSSMGSAFGILGTLLLGEFAVKNDLFGEGVLLLMAFQAVATFAQPSFPLGYTFKFYRLLMTIGGALLGWWGFALGFLIMIVTAATTKTIGGEGYLSPFIPFRPQAVWRLLFRRQAHRDNT